MKLRIVGLMVVLLVLGLMAQVCAKDIYVSIERGKNKKGEGTIASPYKNIAHAAREASPGDEIRIAAGHYPGEGKSGHWVIEKSGLTFVGGFTDDFSARDPFANVTLLAYDDSESNKTKRPAGPDFLAIKDGDAEFAQLLGGITLDGLWFDGGPRNTYSKDPENPSMKPDSTPNDFLLHCAVAKDTVAIVRNCAFINPGKAPAITMQCAPGGKAELYNNVIVNSVFHQLDLGTKANRFLERADFDVHHNTILFSWRDTENGSGVYIRPYVNATIHDNIIGWGDAWALNNSFYEKKIEKPRMPPKPGFMNENVSFDGNVIWMWQRGLYAWVAKGQTGILSSTMLDELEDTSLASAEDNVIADPEIEYNKVWMEHYLNRNSAAEGEITMDSLNKWRQKFGLALIGEGKNRKGYCMRYALEDVNKLRQPAADEASGKGASMQPMGPAQVTASAADAKAAQIKALQDQIQALQDKLDELLAQ